MHLSKLIQQKEHETIEIVLRRHVVTFLPALFIFALMNLIPVIGYFVAQDYFAQNPTSDMIRIGTIMIASILLLLGWLIFYTQFVDFYLDMWVVTNTRIINVEQHGLFGRTVSELDLYKVQDVTSTVKGFWRSIFSYGFVHIQTAGEKERFVFEEINNPHEIRKTILDLIEKATKMRESDANPNMVITEQTNENL